MSLYAAGAGWGEAQSPRLVVDPELTGLLDEADETTKLRAIMTYDKRPTQAHAQSVEATAVTAETFEALPMLSVEGTRRQTESLLPLRAPVSIFADRELEYLLDESRQTVGVERQFGYDRSGVGVAVIDSGVDRTNGDVDYGDRVFLNVKIAGDALFTGNTVMAEDHPNTDTSSGHAGYGDRRGVGTNSDGYYRGMATGSDLVGIGTQDAFFVLYALEALDWALANQYEYDIRVINNSWGTNGEFRENDPVNVASREAHDRE